jgi:tRNA 2-thiouridine synthesizing protein A
VPLSIKLVLECTAPLTVIDVPHFVNQTCHALAAQQRQPLQFQDRKAMTL